MVIVLGCIIGFVILMPLLTLVHEVGHAIPIICSGNKAVITLGGGTPFAKFDLSYVELSTSLFPLNVGYVQSTNELSRFTNIASIIGGPAISLALCILLFVAVGFVSNPLGMFLLRFGFWFCLFQFLFTALPFEYNSLFVGYEGMQSDGKRLLNLLRETAS